MKEVVTLEVKVLKRFRDKTEGLETREPDETLTVNKERGEYLVRRGFAEEIPVSLKKQKNAAG